MKTTNLPAKLPMLPGNVYADPTVTRYHKTQLLGVKDNTICEKNTSLKEPADMSILTSMRTGAPQALTGVPKRPAQQNDAIPRVPPKWLKHDRHVLNFKSYFLEPVVENPTENYRIRKCIIYFYLDDDTFHIIEPRVPNSGIPQGIFLKRAKLLKPDGSGDYDWPDLRLGMDLNVYNRVFRIMDCDDFTRSYYAD